VTGHRTETRDWTFIDDIIDGVPATGVKREAIGEAIYLGADTEHRVIDLAQIVNELTGNAEGVVYAQRRDWDAKMRPLSSIAKAEGLLGYHPQTTFEDGLKSVHRWFVENWDRKNCRFLGTERSNQNNVVGNPGRVFISA